MNERVNTFKSCYDNFVTKLVYLLLKGDRCVYFTSVCGSPFFILDASYRHPLAGNASCTRLFRSIKAKRYFFHR